jgi:HSP20 family protein
MYNIMFSPLAARIFRDNIGYAWPDVDIAESSDSFSFTFEIPGALKENIKIWIDKDVLTVTGEKRGSNSDGQKTISSERNFGKFERSFKMPEHVDSNAVKAKFVDGLLVVTIPKSQEAKVREITIN